MTELIRKYREYVEHLITLSCGDMSNYKLDEARTEDVEGELLHGNNCATWGQSVNNNWVRIPSPEFDKDSWVYLFHDCGVNRIVINAIKYDRSVVVVRYECPDDSD